MTTACLILYFYVWLQCYVSFSGLIDYFTTIFFEVSAACFDGEDNSGVDSKVVLSLLQTMLETLHGLFKYVSDFVRKALQVGQQVGVPICRDFYIAPSR